jgi:hypothetical protein
MDSPARFGQTGCPILLSATPVRTLMLLRTFGLALALLACGLAAAAPATYVGRTPVNSQSDDERSSALRTALANVVIDQSGDGGVLAPDVAKSVAQAERYVLQYSYERNALEDGAPLMLVAHFDAASIDRMLQQHGLGPYAGLPQVPEVATEATAWVGDVRNADDYARVIAYFTRNNFVRAVQPLQAQGDALLLKLSLATDLAHFVEIVALERALAVAPTPVEGADTALTLQH